MEIKPNRNRRGPSRPEQGRIRVPPLERRDYGTFTTDVPGGGYPGDPPKQPKPKEQ